MGNNRPTSASLDGESDNASSAGSSQPHKYFEDQFDDENVLFVFRKHPIVMRKGLIVSSFAVLIGPVYTLAMTYIKPDSPPSLNFFFLSIIASFVLAYILFIPAWMSWHFSVYIVTDQRLIQITQKGFFNRSVVDMALRQIQMVNYEVAGLQETLLGFGTIMMQTLVGDLVIHDVHHPAKIQKKLLEILRREGIAASSSEAEDSNGLANEDSEAAAKMNEDMQARA